VSAEQQGPSTSEPRERCGGAYFLGSANPYDEDPVRDCPGCPDCTPRQQPDPEDGDELERYREIFGEVCWTCGGSGDVPGDLSDPFSGGLKVCPDCNGKGTK
jgi:hypothetical protein